MLSYKTKGNDFFYQLRLYHHRVCPAVGQYIEKLDLLSGFPAAARALVCIPLPVSAEHPFP